MIITYEGGKNFKIKTKALTAKIGDKNILGELTIESPGEYEVGGVQMEIDDGVIQVFAEGLTVGHIQKAKTLTDEEAQKFSNIDILLVGVGGGDFSETKTAKDVINQIDPGFVIPMSDGPLSEFSKEEGGEVKAQAEFKVSRPDLPEEGHETIILEPQK